jgi:hypothetical protein
MKDRRHILVTKRGGSASLPQKSLPGDVAIEVSAIDNLQGDRTTKIGVESLIGDAHGTPA